MVRTDKLPPQALDVEEVALGAMLIEPDAFSRVSGLLEPDMFYKREHAEVYKTMQELDKAGGKIDLLTVCSKNRNLSASFVSKLTGRVASGAHLKEHAAIIYDKWVAREMIKIGSELVARSYTDDIMDVLKETRDRLEGRLLNFLGMTSTGISIMDAAETSIKEYHKRRQIAIEGRRTGVPTCFERLDRKTSGWQNGHLIVLAARPAMGKTSLAVAFLIEAAKAGKSVAFYSLEMSSTKLADKILCSLADVDLGTYKAGKLTSQEEARLSEAMNMMESWSVTFSDSMLTDMEQIRASSQSVKSKQGLDLVIIDYLQLMTSRGNHQTREREVADNSRAAKMMAVELDIPVILLSQLNRGLESRGDKRPMLSDLRESGAIEQDADMVLFAFRESVYTEENRGTDGELIIAKHREGEIGTVLFEYNDSLTQFSDRDAAHTQFPKI